MAGFHQPISFSTLSGMASTRWRLFRHQGGSMMATCCSIWSRTDSVPDLLVMGAYGMHRFRELILGGTTKTVLGADDHSGTDVALTLALPGSSGCGWPDRNHRYRRTQ